ncbi:MAG: protein kinase [Alkalinema sp. RU_4_3]|nr:protein kinase [Alkalinema sp. RU_4_3]
MIYCLNPDCKEPRNEADSSHCVTCGALLSPLLRGRYRVLKSLGRGGFGKTFLAIDEDRLNAKCVIKQFSPQVKGTKSLEKAITLFEQEALRLYELGEHPYIPDLLAYFEHDQRLYLVQQFVEGQTLVQELAQYGTFNEQKIREVLVGLLPILKFVHDRNVIHRDITPSNIIRRKVDGKLVLIDFGVAKLMNDESFGVPGTKIGTEGYAPIEQLRNGRAYPASDIYSLGATCLFLITRTKPEDLYDPLRGLWLWRERLLQEQRSVSVGLGQMLDRMVRDLVMERYGTAADAMRDLRLLLNTPNAILPGPGARPPAGETGGAPAPTQVTGGDRPTSLPPPAPTGMPLAPTGMPQVPTGTPQSNIPTSVPTGVPTGLPTGATAARPVSGQPISRPFLNSQPGPSLSQGVVADYPCLRTFMGHSSWVMALSASQDGKFLVSGGLDDRIFHWDVGTGQVLQILQGHSKPINCLAFSPDGQVIVSGSDDDTVRLWQSATGQPLQVLTGHSQDVNGLAISPDGQFLITGSEDRTVWVWRLATRERLRSFPEVGSMVRTVALSGNGELVAAAGSDAQIRLWNLNGGNLVKTLTGHLNAVLSVALSQDGRFLVSGSKDRTIKIWNLRTGELMRTIVKHLDAVNAVAITPDNRLIITGSSDKTVRIWRLMTGDLLATLTEHTGSVNAIVVSPNQAWFATGASDGRVKIWKLGTNLYG